MTAKKSFRNLGLIRDNNLSDVTSQETSLTNLLNDLVGGDVVFTAKDLDPIQGIADTNISASDFSKIVGATVEQSVLNDNQEVITTTASPFVTIKNRVDGIIVTTNDPPFFSGGNGLPARFWENNKVSSELTKLSSGDDIFIGSEDNIISPFWDGGYFSFGNNIGPNSFANGGVQWQGFYNPSQTGTTDFSFSTSGLFMLELAGPDGTLEVVKSIYAEEIVIAAASAVSNSAIVPISAQDFKFAVIGASVNPASLDQVLVSQLSANVLTNTYFLTLSSPVSFANGELFTLSVTELLGEETFAVSYSYKNLEKYTFLPIRITYWFPGLSFYPNKVLDANYRVNNNQLTNLRFWPLYEEVNTAIPTALSFKQFYDDRLLAGGGTIGAETVSSSLDYSVVASISPLFVQYSPPAVLNDILITTYSYSRTISSNVMSVTSESPLTSSLEIGNVAVGTGLQLGTSIKEISTNNIIVMTDAAVSNASNSIIFVNHRGLAGVISATSSGSSVTVASTATLKKGLIVITNSNSSYVRITSITSSTVFQTSAELSLTGAEIIFIYQDKGLDNRSLDAFCVGVIGKETAAGSGTIVSQGQSIVELNNLLELTSGMVVQSTGFISDGTTIVSINTSTNEITISSNVLEDMISGITIVFAPAGTTLNKEQCIVPLNTAPPFSGTDTGLATVGDVTLNNGLARLNVVSLNATSVPVTELETTTPTYNQKVAIQLNRTPYFILGLSG